MLTTLRLLIAKAPVWAWYLFIALIIAALLFLAGQRNGATKVHRKALSDSVVVKRAVVDTAATKSVAAIAVADEHAKKAAPLRDRARAAVADTGNHVPVAVMAVVDSALAEDSTTIAKKDTAIVAQHEEIVARIELDTLTQHQIVFKPPGDAGLSVVDVAKDVAIVAVVLEIGLRLWHFLHGE